MPRLQRIVFDNTLSQQDAVELVKTGEGRVDLVSELSPLETLPVARSPFAKVVKNAGQSDRVRSVQHAESGEPVGRRAAAPGGKFRRQPRGLIRYAAKGNGLIIPALIAAGAFGYDPALPPYPFDPGKARHLLREAGYPDGLTITLIATEDLKVQATVIGKMLEQVGFKVEVQMLDRRPITGRRVSADLDQPAEQQAWDIALSDHEMSNFPALALSLVRA